jgi:N-acetylglucosaminyldiphosphoundecaprenol N-acetyl-beta-D-mannosaminyltransferase
MGEFALSEIDKSSDLISALLDIDEDEILNDLKEKDSAYTRHHICNIPVDALTMKQTIQLIDNAIIEKRPIHHVAINAAKVVNAQKDIELRKSIVGCNIINADGQSIVWASKFLNKQLPERVTGIDLMDQLIKLAAEKNYRVYFLGATEEVVKKVVDIYVSKYGNGIIAGYHNGYFQKDHEEFIAKEIADSSADILFVAMTSPKKEIFLNTYKESIKTPFIMGVGGSFDVVSGLVKRAPKWMQNSGLEWFYRVIQEPKRMWKRYLIGNSAFIFLVLKERLRLFFY